MILKYSEHALRGHEKETWNAKTISHAYTSGAMSNIELLEGKTADILCGDVSGECVGLVLGKSKFGVRVIITGFSASREYWHSV